MTGRQRGRGDPVRNLVFVVGSPRSGTTFLARALSRIPGFTYCHEPLLTKSLVGCVYRVWIPLPVARVLFELSYRTWLLVRGRGACRLIEKTPRNCTILGFLSNTFPGAKFIHIVRDPRDAVVSHLAQPWLVGRTDRLPIWHPHRLVWGSRPRFWVEPDRRGQFSRASDVRRVTWEWRRYNEMALVHGGLLSPARYHRVHYEALATGSRRITTELTEFLGLEEADASSLGHAIDSFTAVSIGQWRRALTREQCREVVQEAGELMKDFGYFVECAAL